MKEQLETEKTSANYNINLYALVQQAIAAYSEYEDYLIQTHSFKKSNPEEDLDITIAENIKNTNTFLRRCVSQINVHFETLNVGETDNDTVKKVRDAFKKLNNDYVLNKDNLFIYIILVNKYVLDTIIPETSQGTNMTSMYN